VKRVGQPGGLLWLALIEVSNQMQAAVLDPLHAGRHGIPDEYNMPRAFVSTLGLGAASRLGRVDAMRAVVYSASAKSEKPVPGGHASGSWLGDRFYAAADGTVSEVKRARFATLATFLTMQSADDWLWGSLLQSGCGVRHLSDLGAAVVRAVCAQGLETAIVAAQGNGGLMTRQDLRELFDTLTSSAVDIASRDAWWRRCQG
jgi:hypothetical protein